MIEERWTQITFDPTPNNPDGDWWSLIVYGAEDGDDALVEVSDNEDGRVLMPLKVLEAMAKRCRNWNPIPVEEDIPF